MTPLRRRWLVEAGAPLDLSQRDPAELDAAPGDKEQTKACFKDLRHQLRDLQARLWAENERSLLIVLQALDAGGKDGTIKHVFRGVNPMGTVISSFKTPTETELEHDFLWRIHQATPARGEIGVFNRSHYEDVLVVRVRGLVPEKVWRPRFEHIRNFEANLVDAGTRIVKIFLHISKDEQAARFRRRLERPDKRWKFRLGDLEERKQWTAYQEAFEEALGETTTADAPWYVVPADHKWYRNWVVSQILIETLTEMDPRFPEPEEDLSGVIVE